ncbi:MAG: YciI family protein [Lacipirellulaceae bacterium]
MQYCLLIYETATETARRNGPDAPAYWEAWMSFTQAITASGVMRGGAGLMPADTATTLTLGAAGNEVHDGPYADTKEQLGGFYLIDVASLDEALAWGAKIPCPGGKIEVRPVMVNPDHPA